MQLLPRYIWLIIVVPLLLYSCKAGNKNGTYESIIKQAGFSNEKKLLVVVFINPECPITQKYTRTLNELSDSLNESTLFVGVIPGKLFNGRKITDFRKEFAFKIPIIKDEQYAITKTLSATVYPEVVLLNQKSEKLYSGKIDNWYESVGNYRAEPTEFYLKEAIKEYLHNGTVSTKSTKAVGCFINYERN